MSNDKLRIPEKVKVGFNMRSDTYSGKLGYVIYHDGKVWRKEHSWESWRQKVGDAKSRTYDYEKRQYIESDSVYGEEVAPLEFDNVPTTGFVLNKKVGGHSSGWNHRSTYCRVFDPRGFEFEITLPNLLFILQETDSMKGKGLTGDFVYSWDGKDLVLLPCGGVDYLESKKHTDLQKVKFSSKDLIVGATYKTKKSGEQVVYLGFLQCLPCNYHYSDGWLWTGGSLKNQHVFGSLEKPSRKNEEFLFKSPSEYIGQCLEESTNAKFAELLYGYGQSPFGQKVVSHGYTKVVGENDFEKPHKNYYGSVYYGRPIPKDKILVLGESKRVTIEYKYDQRGSCYLVPIGEFDLVNYKYKSYSPDIVENYVVYPSLGRLIEANSELQFITFTNQQGEEIKYRK